jgi:hypothetical protein
MVRRAGLILCIVSTMLSGISAAHAQKRVALVVGNDTYANLPADQQLRKAVNDARAVGDALTTLGFQVIRGDNLGRQGLVDKLDELSRRLAPGDIAFFFFAGHGVSLGGGNYVLPSDVPNIEPGQEIRLARAALGEAEIVADLQSRGARVAVVVLDACRNNPFVRPGARRIGAERGLARVEPSRGIFMLYSAGIGQVALDRLNDRDANPNSVFTRALVPSLTRPGLDLGALAVEVREQVSALAGSVGHDQRPAYYDETIGGRIYLAGQPKATDALASLAAAPAPAGFAPPAAASEAERMWASIERSNNPAEFEIFAKRFPDSPYAELARVRMKAARPTLAALDVSPPKARSAPHSKRLETRRPAREARVRVCRRESVPECRARVMGSPNRVAWGKCVFRPVVCR